MLFLGAYYTLSRLDATNLVDVPGHGPLCLLCCETGAPVCVVSMLRFNWVTLHHVVSPQGTAVQCFPQGVCLCDRLGVACLSRIYRVVPSAQLWLKAAGRQLVACLCCLYVCMCHLLVCCVMLLQLLQVHLSL